MKVELEKVKKRRQVIKTTASTHTHTNRHYNNSFAGKRERERSKRRRNGNFVCHSLPISVSLWPTFNARSVFNFAFC